MQRSKWVFWIVVLALAASSTSYADSVAIKRAGDLSIDVGLSQSFKDAISSGAMTVYTDASTGKDVVDDAYIVGAGTSAPHNNYGASPADTAKDTILARFDLSVLPGFTGAAVIKAELRYYCTPAAATDPTYNMTGLQDTGYITFSRWTEGTKTGTAPGAAGGVTYNGPNCTNTNTSDTPTWAGGTAFAATTVNPKDGTVVMAGFNGKTRTAYTGDVPGLAAPTADGFVVIDVLSIVQGWANDPEHNYGFFSRILDRTPVVQLTETTYGAQFQPVLVIEYLQNSEPNRVIDLAVAGTDWYKVDLRWTAPTDVPPGPIHHYEIRYSTTQIDADNFASANMVTAPAPAAPGNVQTVSVTGLSPDATYYFAIRCYDIAGLSSPLSEVVSATTSPPDTVAPDTTLLTTTVIKANNVRLSWSDSGDDGMAGQAAGYELRYSTDPIDESTWGSATVVSGTPAVGSAGTAQTMLVSGLTPSTTYYFAVRYKDEVPNWSALAVLTVSTPPADLVPPTPVADFTFDSAQSTRLHLKWTAPEDRGANNAGPYAALGYDLRYSTTVFPAGGDAAAQQAWWDAATQASGLAAPSAPGTAESFTVAGLTPDTDYYLAIRSIDDAEPSNVSDLSNIVVARTRPTLYPITVLNPWLVNDRVADTHNINTMGATYGYAYTPDGVIAPATDEQKAINVYNNQKRRLYHWTDEPMGKGGYVNTDAAYNQNIFGWALCGRHAHMGMTIARLAGFSDTRNCSVPGHNIYEVYYDNGWHIMDTMTTMYVYTKGANPHVASLGEISADHSLVLNAVADGRACPGFLLCGDTPSWWATSADDWHDTGHTVAGSTWTGNMGLRTGQVFERTWESWLNQHPVSQSDVDKAPGNDPPYHHEAGKTNPGQGDDEDYVNYPYWEPYRLTSAESAALNIPMIPTFRRWANGTDTLAPDFHSDLYQPLLYSSTSIATYNNDNLTPDLHANAIGVTAEAVFKIDLPFHMTDSNVSGDFVKTNVADICKVYYSLNGSTWTQVYDAPVGTTHVSNLSLRPNMIDTNGYGPIGAYYVKVQLKGTVAKTDAGVNNFVVVTTFEHNKGAMAYLDKGVNHITVTFDNATALQASHNAVHVVYKWKEYDGTNWTIARQTERYVTTSPCSFKITVGGTKVPRTESILMEVVEPPPPDPIAPAAVTDLAAPRIMSTAVDLTWTAPADDGNNVSSGPAAEYDLRYSTSLITAENFGAATPVSMPMPGAPLSVEGFRVRGLRPETTYYFAIKASDEAFNVADISNILEITTPPPPPPPPASVTDLEADTTTTLGQYTLTWTAPADVGEGYVATYDLRYSIIAITADNFTSATPIPVDAPKSGGSRESFTVTSLPTGTRVYFALKCANDSGIWSDISNVAWAKEMFGTKVLQNGLDGYTGCQDTYMSAETANVNTKYEGSTELQLAGFGGTNRRRSIIKFDLNPLPARAVIQQATLYLYASSNEQHGAPNGYYAAHRVNTSWAAADVSWNKPWLVSGGADINANYDARVPKQAGSGVWYSFDVTSRVQDFISNGGNNGWVIKCYNETDFNSDWFYACEYTGDITLRPKLVVSDETPHKIGDANSDGYVNVGDLQLLVAAWGSNNQGSYLNWDLNCDFNTDGYINVGDLQLLVANWNQ